LHGGGSHDTARLSPGISPQRLRKNLTASLRRESRIESPPRIAANQIAVRGAFTIRFVRVLPFSPKKGRNHVCFASD
jgi:hypothetical protein